MTAGPAITPPPGKAAIIVYRPAKIPGVLLQTSGASRVAFDDQWISALNKGENFAFYAWPGQHRIESAIGVDREGTVQLDVKAGETYYVAAGPSRPTPVSLVSSLGTKVSMVDKETAEKEMTGSKPVEWARDLLEGTISEIGSLDALPTNVTECGNVEWNPDIDSIKTSAFHRSSILKGAVLVSDEALILKLSNELQGSVPMGVRIPLRDIASVGIKNKMMLRIVLVTRKSGRLDSFSVLTSGGGRIDRDRTTVCAGLLTDKLGHS